MAKKLSIPTPPIKTQADSANALSSILGTSFAPNKQITMLSVSQLEAYPKQHILGMRELEDLTESIKEIGITTPLIVRQVEGAPAASYQIITGHRRKEAAILAGLTEVPAIIENLDDDQADLVFCDNLYQRSKLLPSERGFALKIQLEALERKAGSKEPIMSKLAEDFNTNRKKVYRDMKITDLTPKLLDMVDNEVIPFYAGLELSYLPESMQHMVLDVMEAEEVKIPIKKAEKIKSAYDEGQIITEIDMKNIICPPKAAAAPVVQSTSRKKDLCFRC